MLKTLRMNIRWTVCLVGCIALGCGSMGARRARSAPATQASASPRKLNIADGKPIAQYRNGERDVDLTNRISYEGDNILYFGQADTYNDDGDVKSTLPLVVASVKGRWLALNVEDSRVKDAEWQFVATGPADGEIWGVLDDSLNHKAAVLLLAHSTDYGKTWTVTSVQKPFGAGDFDSFCLDKSGRGRLSVYVSLDDKHPNCAGFYHLRTTDSAKTWSAAEHELDALDPAEDIPEDEEVAPLKETPTQNAGLNQRQLKPSTSLRITSASLEAHR